MSRLFRAITSYSYPKFWQPKQKNNKRKAIKKSTKKHKMTIGHFVDYIDEQAYNAIEMIHTYLRGVSE